MCACAACDLVSIYTPFFLVVKAGFGIDMGLIASNLGQCLSFCVICRLVKLHLW